MDLCAEAVREYQRTFLALNQSALSSVDSDGSHTSSANQLSRLLEQHRTWIDRNIGCQIIDQPKPQHSYIGLIAMAILSSPEKKMVLSEVYEWIMCRYSYFRTRGSGWRNSIRHNLSLNDCFIKAGRAANGKGHYWAVHPACVRDFERGDFRRRRAQRKVRRHMGLSVPEGDSSDESAPSTPVHFNPFSFVPFVNNTPQTSTQKNFSIEFLLRDVTTAL